MPKDLSCGVHFARGLLLFFNVIFIIFGLVLIGFGIYVKVNNNFSSILDQFTGEKGFEAQSLGFLAFAMIGGGVFTLFIALFGCMGTLWNKRCLLYFYATILSILMLIELIGLILAFVYRAKLTDVYDTALLGVFNKGLEENNPKIVNAFHELENALKCCGIHNISDYDKYSNTTQYSDGCKQHPMDGCSEKIIALLDKNLPIVGYSLLSIFLLEFLGVIAAVVLAVALKHAPNENYSTTPVDVFRDAVPGRRRNYS